jgi:hypothetical protein
MIDLMFNFYESLRIRIRICITDYISTTPYVCIVGVHSPGRHTVLLSRSLRAPSVLRARSSIPAASILTPQRLPSSNTARGSSSRGSFHTRIEQLHLRTQQLPFSNPRSAPILESRPQIKQPRFLPSSNPHSGSHPRIPPADQAAAVASILESSSGSIQKSSTRGFL